ncbi:phosphatidylglycerophosphatase A family protein [Rickettsia endosymbiont of Cardiosporidium cionae]|uniref:phosphatidylglycerophosphatase A family protein n=1 Tax=Rickettsia endosymbiont of Cardiosporidium cionae TaxID=2777155 RepID=UPI0018962FB0|nr:phosphatidylglycerophosphatase A [Rickettsia endosymbiont of Cardiosporidium cionae]KAF8818391.1 phosphatidylglycerophosphatase A [Rickettsia endosymbiont of Cardiosporidium cionae]
MHSYKYFIAEFFVTFCYLGKVKYAPGTWGSLISVIIYFCVIYINISNIQNIVLITLVINCIILIISRFLISIYSREYNHYDRQEIIIDEIIGQFFTLIFSPLSFWMVDLQNICVFSQSIHLFQDFNSHILVFSVTSFICFRIFDILKPWPIYYLEKTFNNSFGVLIDDLLASCFAIITQHSILFVINYMLRTT